MVAHVNIQKSTDLNIEDKVITVDGKTHSCTRIEIICAPCDVKLHQSDASAKLSFYIHVIKKRYMVQLYY